jgi:hypothetical protein
MVAPVRLAELQTEPCARHWRRMHERRGARLAYLKEHKELPPRWMPLWPGKPYRRVQLAGFLPHRKAGLAKWKARARKHPLSSVNKITNRDPATKRIRPRPRKLAALNDAMVLLVANYLARQGKSTLREYETLQSKMLSDDALPRRFRRETKTTGESG